jgi:hypothetical protein
MVCKYAVDGCPAHLQSRATVLADSPQRASLVPGRLSTHLTPWDGQSTGTVALARASVEDGVPDQRLLERTNVNGGAIAIGLPLGASGARIMTTLVNSLEQCGGRYGLQTMCEGGGMANATIIERLSSAKTPDSCALRVKGAGLCRLWASRRLLGRVGWRFRRPSVTKKDRGRWR